MFSLEHFDMVTMDEMVLDKAAHSKPAQLSAGLLVMPYCKPLRKEITPEIVDAKTFLKVFCCIACTVLLSHLGRHLLHRDLHFWV
jgi:hypothetical protein